MVPRAILYLFNRTSPVRFRSERDSLLTGSYILACKQRQFNKYPFRRARVNAGPCILYGSNVVCSPRDTWPTFFVFMPLRAA